MDEDENVFKIWTTIDSYAKERLFRFFKKAQERGERDINIHLSTPGGRWDPSYVMYEMIHTFPFKTTAVVKQECSSLGILVLQACAHRVMEKDAFLRFHHLYGKNFKKRKICEELFILIIVSRTKQNEESVKTWFENDKIFSAQEALDVGLIDKII